DNQIGSRNFFRQPDHFGNNVETRSDNGVTKSQQPKTKTASRARSRNVTMIPSEIFRCHLGQSGQRAFKNFELLRSCAFLRAKSSGGAFGSEQWIAHIAGGANSWHAQFVRRLNPNELCELRYRTG